MEAVKKFKNSEEAVDRAPDVIEAGREKSRGGTTNSISPDIIRSLREDGAVLIKNVLNPDELSIVKEIFDYQLGQLTPWSLDEKTTNTRFVIDAINPAAWEAPIYQKLWNETKLLDLAEKFFTTPEVWLWYSQVFFKQASAGEVVKRTEWHQDLMYDALVGGDLLRFWISLDPLDKGYALDFVRGSHRGPVYNAGAYSEEEALTANNGEPMPPIPDIEADRSQWDIVTWAVEPGDIVAFHPGVLHGGGPTKPNGIRRTLTMLFFGRDTRYSTRPVPSQSDFSIEADQITRERFANAQPGDPAWLSTAPRLR